MAEPYSVNFETWNLNTEKVWTEDPWDNGDPWWTGHNVGIYDNSGGFPAGASTANAAWFASLSDGNNYHPWLSSPTLTNGAGTISLACCSYVSGTNIFAIGASTNENGPWTIKGLITNSTYRTWVTNSVVINDYSTNLYILIVKTNDFNNSEQFLGIDNINISLPPSYVIITNVSLAPQQPIVDSPTYVSATITPEAFASNISATVYYSTDNGASFSPVSMVTTGANYFYTDTEYLTNPSVPGNTVLYYIKAAFEGVAGSYSTNYWPAGAPANRASYVVHKFPFTSWYSNMTVKGSLQTNMILTANNQWQAVTSTNNLTNPNFYFNAGTTNWGDASQSISNLSVYGKVIAGNTNIHINGSTTNHLSFLFNETNMEYSVENCAFANFITNSVWTNASVTNLIGTYTNKENWVIINGRINKPAEMNRSFVSNFCFLTTNSIAGIQAVQSPELTNGIGLVSFWYRNYSTTAAPPAGLTLQKSVDKTNWITVAEVTNIISIDYFYFTNNIGNPDYRYVRILNNTNGVGAMSQLCLDEIAVTEPKAVVKLSNPQITPSSPSCEASVSVSIDFVATNGASNVTGRLYYRAHSSTVFDSSPMTLSDADTFAGTIPPVQPGQIDYYFECTYEGFRAGPVTYPAAAPLSYLYYTNSPSPMAYRFQNFDTWDGAPYTDFDWQWYLAYNGWEIWESGIFNHSGAFPWQISEPCSAWFADMYDGWRPGLQSPLFTNGIGTVYIASMSYLEGTNIFAVEVCATYDGNFTTIAYVTNSTTGAWITNAVVVNAYTNLYLRLTKTNDFMVDGQLMGIDNIVASPPPASVTITNIFHAPGYPAASEDVTVTATITSDHTNFPAFSIVPRICYLSNGGAWQTNDMTSIGANMYSGIIPACPIGPLSYYIRCEFDGYYYTNGVISENKSPTLSTNCGYTVRRFISPFGSVVVTGNFGSVSMNVSGENEWQGVWKYTNGSISVASFSFAGYQQYTNGGYSSATNTWGDSDQVTFTLPLTGSGDSSSSNIMINMNTQFYGSIIFNLNTTNNYYVIRRGAYQDFNDWAASPDYFEESLDLFSISTTPIDLDSWPTNNTYITIPLHGLEDFQSFAFPWTNGWVQYTDTAIPGQQVNPSSNEWYIDNMQVGRDANLNLMGILRETANIGMAFPWRIALTEGLRTFNFDFRVMSTDHYHTVYSPGGNSWSNYCVEAYLYSTNTSPGYSYLSMFARLKDMGNYYEYRLARISMSALQVEIHRRNAFTWSCLASNILSGPNYITNQVHLAKLVVVTNNSGYVYLEAYYNGELRCTAYDTTASANKDPGTIGFLTREADISVDRVGTRYMDIQRFGYWSKNAPGTYSNAGWVIKDGYPSNSPDRCVLPTKLDAQTGSQNFDSWPVSSWGTYTNNDWIISDGSITSSIGAYSPTNFAWLRNDGSFTNSWLQTPPFTNTIENISFYCKNVGTTSIQFQVLTSTNGSDWQVQSTLTNIDNSFQYNRKAKIRFKGYNKDETLTNFPVLVTLSTNIAGFSYSDFTSTNGYDLRFADSNEMTELSYEIDSWDPLDDSPPVNIGGCVMWLRADVGVTTDGVNGVTAWADQSGNGNDVTLANGSPTYIPSWTNGMPAVYFDGNDRLIRSSTINFPSNNWHIFIVQRTRNVQNSFIFRIDSRSPAYVSSRIPWGDGTVYWDCGGWSGEPRIYQGGLTTTTFSVWQLVSCNNSLNRRQQIWQDGVLRVYDTTAVTVNDASGRLFELGYGEGSYMNSELAELIIYKDDLTTAQQKRIGAYLAKKYNITAPAYQQSGNSYVWVKVPSISSTNSYIWAYWGGAGITNPPPYTTNGSTWSENYEAVWHMNQADATDSSRKGYDCISYGTMLGDSFVGQSAQGFTGISGTYLDVADGMASFKGMTVSVWANPTATRSWARFIDFGNGSANNNILLARNGTGNNLSWQIYVGGSSSNLEAGSAIANGQWQQFTATVSTNGYGILYKNGIQIASRVMQKPLSFLRRNNYIGKSNWADDYYQGYMDEMSISSVERSSNWIWAAWYNTSSNSTFYEFTNVVTASGALTNWNAYQIGPLTSARYLRIFKSQATSAGQWLGVDSAAAFTPAPNITSPYIPYSPAQLQFSYVIQSDTTNFSQVKVLASPDGQSWTTIAGPFSAPVSTLTYPWIYQSPNLAGYHYYRIENPSTNLDLIIKDIYIQSPYIYYEQFQGATASGWSDPDTKWYVDTGAQTYNRRAYPIGPVGFVIETNYCTDIVDYPPGPWGTVASGSSSNLQYRSRSTPIYFWDNIYVRVRHTTGNGNLIIDNLTMSSWRGTNYVDSNNWAAAECWVAHKNPGETNSRALEFWSSRADPAALARTNQNIFQGLRSPPMTTGVGTISFDYKAANPPVNFEIQHTIPGFTNLWSTLTNSITTVYNSTWNTYSLPINESHAQYVRIVHSSTNPAASYMSYDYYEVPTSFSLPTLLSDFNAMTPVMSGMCTNFTFNMTNLPGFRGSYHVFKFTGKINIPEEGLWTFVAGCDDYSKLYIDGILVAYNNGWNVTGTGTVNITSAGWHDIIVTAYNGAGGGGFPGVYPHTYPQFEGPSTARQRIPDSYLIFQGGGPIMYIDNVQVSDYRPRDNRMWWAYNAKITASEDAREFEGKTCYLNNDPSSGARPTVSYSSFLPCVQTPYMQYGIGEIGFWYRRWDSTGTNTATIYVRASTNYNTIDSECSQLFTLPGISNSEYRYFSTNLYIPTNYYLRISCETNKPTLRFCIDNITIVEPLAANLEINSITLDPVQPLYINPVSIYVELGNFIYSPSNIDLKAYYYVGTNAWATNWPTTNCIPMVYTGTGATPYSLTFVSASNIPAKPTDTVVQYYLWCNFDGWFATNTAPKVSRRFSNPSWYYPVDLNAGKSVTNPYYFVYSCPTDSVWINEVNIVDGDGSATNQFVELCGKTDAIISNWWLEVMIPGYTTSAVYVIKNNSILQNDTNMHGFWLLASNGVAAADMNLTNTLPAEAGARLRRSMGAIERGVCWGDPSTANAGKDMVTNVSQRFVYIGFDDWWAQPPEASLSLIGTGTNYSDFTWGYATPSPHRENFGQIIVEGGNPIPPLITITISNFWIVSNNVYISFSSTASNDIRPSPWYSTNLIPAPVWYAVSPVSTSYYQPTGIYTQWFVRITNSPVYYKIVSTNAQ